MKNEQTNTPQECPTCWGRQEYNGKKYHPTFRKVVNGNNAKKQLGWINAYAQKYLQAPPRSTGKTKSILSPISYKLI